MGWGFAARNRRLVVFLEIERNAAQNKSLRGERKTPTKKKDAKQKRREQNRRGHEEEKKKD